MPLGSIKNAARIFAPESSYAFSESGLRKSGPCGALLTGQLRWCAVDHYASMSRS